MECKLTFGVIFQNLDSPAYQHIITNHSWWEPREEAIYLLLHSAVVIKGKESFTALLPISLVQAWGKKLNPNA